MAKMRMPPDCYIFDHTIYAQDNNEYDNEKYTVEVAAKIKSLYPELRTWPNWACCVAYMDYGEAINDCGNPYNGEPREEEFIAFLYAEQELNMNGYFVRQDGRSFTRYDLDQLETIWERYDHDIKRGR